MPLRCDRPSQTDTAINIGDSRIEVVQQDLLSVSHDEVINWVRAAARSVEGYYKRYPVPYAQVRVNSFSGKGIRGGQTFPSDVGGRISIRVGDEATVIDLKDDWMMTHEMIHLTFPSVAERHHWIEEGVAVYVEPIARVRSGHLDEAKMWYEVARDLPQGLPQAGDEGLDHTHTWGRTYWGGALFCLLADVEIHRRSNNQEGLEDALRGILDAGGDIRHDWDLERVFTIGDHATGEEVLMRLYQSMKDKPVTPDLATLWKDLGVEVTGTTVRFRDDAPLAATRRAITWGASGGKMARSH
jgi:hypothetical protein